MTDTRAILTFDQRRLLRFLLHAWDEHGPDYAVPTWKAARLAGRDQVDVLRDLGRLLELGLVEQEQRPTCQVWKLTPEAIDPQPETEAT